MSARRVRKAIIPAAGLGTRMLPATKAIPKEMLPVFDKPLIHYAVEELLSSGIEAIMIVIAANKHVIEDHFASDPYLERELHRSGKTELLASLRESMPKEGSIAFVRQSARLGLGHAVWCAREWVGEEPVFVSTPDELLLAEPTCVSRMRALYSELDCKEATLLAAMRMPAEETQHYGVLLSEQEPQDGALFRVSGLVEKPKLGSVDSTLCSIGRYILPSEIFARLDEHIAQLPSPFPKREIQLTDAISHLQDTVIYGWLYEGTRYDCGRPDGWLAANTELARQAGKRTP